MTFYTKKKHYGRLGHIKKKNTKERKYKTKFDRAGRVGQIFRSHGLHAVVMLWGLHSPRHRSYRGKRAISEQTATALGSLRASSLLEPVTGLLQ